MNLSQLPISPTAVAAFEAAGLKPATILIYTARWKRWEAWCTGNDVDPLAATYEDYLKFLAENEPSWAKATVKMLSNAMSCVYRYLGKNSPSQPARQVGAVTTAFHQTWFNKFRAWCEARGKTPIPAQPQDVVAFLTAASQSYAPYNTRIARAAIGWHHQNEGYPTPTDYPEVHHMMADLKDHHPRGSILTLKTVHGRERHRKMWATWSQEHGIDPYNPTPDDLCAYVQHHAERVLRVTVREYVSSIAAMLDDPSLVRSDSVKKAIAAVPKTRPVQRPSTSVQQEVAAEIQRFMELIPSSELWNGKVPKYLKPEQHNRIRQAMVAADVTRETLHTYIRTGWIPMKRWCQAMGIAIETAEAGDVAAFLCELSERVSPTSATSARTALAYCFQQFRPLDNPANNLDVRKAVQGLRRERPRPPAQVDPITETEFVLIRATAHRPRHKERPHDTRLRAAVDIAMIGTMRDSMLRGKEAAEALWCHVMWNKNGTGTLTIPRSKTDQFAEGAAGHLSKRTMNDLSTMRQAMLEMGIQIAEDDLIFRMSIKVLPRRIKDACHAAGLRGRYASHSPRVGMTQDLAMSNTGEVKLAQAGRWKNGKMPVYYARKIKASKNAVANWYARNQNNGKAKQTNPLSAYGLIMSHAETKTGH